MNVVAMSRKQAEDAWIEPGVAVISIREPGDRKPRLHGNPVAVLYMEFDDCEPIDGGEFDTGYGRELFPMTSEQAEEVATFIRAHADAEFLVHCLAGISRSVAVASCIAKWRGEDWERVECGKCPNTHVRKLVTEALGAPRGSESQ